MKSDIRSFILLIVFSALLWQCAPIAHAADIDVFVGRTMWTRSDNGTWWETPFKEEWPSSASSWSIGLSDEFASGWRWNVGYSNLGTIHSYGQAVGDDIYGATNGCTTGTCPAPDDWYGRGNVDGVYFTVSPQYMLHSVTYSAEIGVWNYQPESIVYVPKQHPCGLCNPSTELTNQYFITSSDRMWGQVFGIGLQYGSLMLRYRAYWVNSSDKEYPAIYQGYTNELAIGWRF